MQTYLGIELGSTRIKAAAIDEHFQPVSAGDYTWASAYEKGIWTYHLEQVWEGLRAALSRVQHRETITAMGISAMMHGYLAFDRDWNLLVPFRTWQNTMTGQAAAELTEQFGVNIPQRWSIAHLYQAMLNGEEHVSRIAHITTLAGYVHYMLTGVHAVGIGEASGMFPIDSDRLDYDKSMMEKFDALAARWNLPWKLADLLPRVLTAGQPAGYLTAEGAQKLGGLLAPGIPAAPPEGDAGTGMTATNAVAPRTGNVSAGTSIFSMVVLERPLQHMHEEIDLVTTPAGKPVAMVHCNNCTNDTNAWADVLDDAGRPLVARCPDSRFTLANFFRAQLYATMATLKIGMDILAGEGVRIDSLTGHGGLFKTPQVGQRYLAAACNAPVTCLETAGEGGPYGMALLAAYMHTKEPGQTLEDYLHTRVFAGISGTTLAPDPADAAGFDRYIKRYHALLEVERRAVEMLKEESV